LIVLCRTLFTPEFRIFEPMQVTGQSSILIENNKVLSIHLEREVKVDFFLPRNVAEPGALSLLLINDGQNMSEIGLEQILDKLYGENIIRPVLCAAIHAGEERKMEYGVAVQPDYKGRGAKASAYTSFIIDELIPFIMHTYAVRSFHEIAFAGFSLGALSALDITWNHPEIFKKTGVFSGSLWWRSIDQHDEEYEDDKHRIMHQQVRNGAFKPGLKFFFQCGNMDEVRDRNVNGIIDSIDDTLDLIKELENKGYDREKDIYYLELADGHHDMPTWGRAMPFFLKWAFCN